MLLFSLSVVSNSLQPYGLQHARLPCPSLSQGVCSNSSIESVIPSNHLILCSPPTPSALNLSQYQGIFQWVDPSHQVAKVLEFQLQHQSFQWIFRVDFQLHPKILPSDIVILGITLQQMNQRVSQSLAVVLWSALFNTINHTPFLYWLQMGFSNYTLAKSPSYHSSPSEVPSWVLITLLALCPPLSPLSHSSLYPRWTHSYAQLYWWLVSSSQNEWWAWESDKRQLESQMGIFLTVQSQARLTPTPSVCDP